VLKNIFDKKTEPGSSALPSVPSGPKYSRHSGAWATLRKRLKSEPGLRVIDAGSTSPHNINYLTSLGHSIFLADPLTDALSGEWQVGKDEDDKPIWNVDGYLEHAFQFSGRTFDIVLLWTVLDYLPEPLVAPVVNHLHAAVNPGGQVLAFFHARKKEEEGAYCRFHVTDTDTVEMQVAQPFALQRAFTNRGIQELFSRWSGFRQFLAKDSVYEVLITR
jgi:Methyltransferase domain